MAAKLTQCQKCETFKGVKLEAQEEEGVCVWGGGVPLAPSV